MYISYFVYSKSYCQQMCPQVAACLGLLYDVGVEGPKRELGLVIQHAKPIGLMEVKLACTWKLEIGIENYHLPFIIYKINK